MNWWTDDDDDDDDDYDTINTFKNRLDKFWSDQEVLYDYNTDLHGIGNRSLL